jgi:geranylgeranyl diphosphate synthase type II
MHVIYLSIITVLIIIIVLLYARLRKVKDTTDMLPARKIQLRELTAGPKTVMDYRKEINDAIKTAYDQGDFGIALPSNAAMPSNATSLSGACYDALVGGKRIRSTILLEVGRAVNPDVDLIESALAIEYIHAASLIIDDLPEFDNDLERRGRPSTHAAYGPAVAKLASLTLMSAAFQNLCYQVNWLKRGLISNADATGILVLNYISKNLGGTEGISLGQFMDISRDKTNLVDLMQYKTGCLFRLSVVMGYLFAGGDANYISEIDSIGSNLGIAFQIADDIGDMAQDSERAAHNYALEHGRDAAVAKVNEHLTAATEMLKSHGLFGSVWKDEIFPMINSMMQI